MKITTCKGEGLGSCTNCDKNGKWNRIWMSMLYKIEGMDGIYCSDCVKEITGKDLYIKNQDDNGLK